MGEVRRQLGVFDWHREMLEDARQRYWETIWSNSRCRLGEGWKQKMAMHRFLGTERHHISGMNYACQKLELLMRKPSVRKRFGKLYDERIAVLQALSQEADMKLS